MKIEVLGCHGSETPTTKTVGFLINDQMLLEAGTASSVLSMERQKKIESVVISHMHLDHIKSLPFLAENRFGETEASLTVYGIAEVIQGLRTHCFNDTVWPDITKITNGKIPLLQFQTLIPGESTQIGEVKLLPIVADHSVPSVGLLLSQQDRSLLYTGDTAPTGEIWEVAAKTPDLSALMIEASFPDRLHKIANISYHMTPSMLASALQKIGRPEVPVYVFHMKPQHERIILKELNSLLGERVHVLKEGEVIQL